MHLGESDCRIQIGKNMVSITRVNHIFGKTGDQLRECIIFFRKKDYQLLVGFIFFEKYTFDI